MLNDEIIAKRLQMMSSNEAPDSLWPENCAGSSKALVIFVGPSPGGKKASKRRNIHQTCNKPLWDEPYRDPLDWSRGFRVSFKPIVEKIIQRPYDEAAKLIARVNLDWMQNPESKDVSYRYMWEGCSYALPVISECEPELVVPMDEKTFGVLQIALYDNGYQLFPVEVDEVNIKISNKNGKARYHKRIMAFRASKEEQSFVVLKSLQHPARIFDGDYARRIGEAIRLASEQICRNDPVKVNL